MLDGHARRRAARPAHPHRDRSPLGSRMGRVGRQAAARQRRLLRTSRAVLPARRPVAGGRPRCDWSADLPARPAARGRPARPTRAAVGRAGGRGRRERAVVCAAAPFLLWRRAAVA